MSWTGTVRCSYCGDEGHNRRKCPTMQRESELNPHGYAATEINMRQTHKRPRRCSFCKATGHNKKTCDSREFYFNLLKKLDCEYKESVIAEMKEKSLGPGAIIVQNSPRMRIYVLDKIYWERVSVLGERMGSSLTQPWRSALLCGVKRKSQNSKVYYNLLDLLALDQEQHGLEMFGMTPAISEKYFRNLKLEANTELYKEFLDHYGRSGIVYFLEERGVPEEEQRELQRVYEDIKNNT